MSNKKFSLFFRLLLLLQHRFLSCKRFHPFFCISLFCCVHEHHDGKRARDITQFLSVPKQTTVGRRERKIVRLSQLCVCENWCCWWQCWCRWTYSHQLLGKEMRALVVSSRYHGHVECAIQILSSNTQKRIKKKNYTNESTTVCKSNIHPTILDIECKRLPKKKYFRFISYPTPIAFIETFPFPASTGIEYCFLSASFFSLLFSFLYFSFRVHALPIAQS